MQEKSTEQLYRLKKTARALDCDDEEARFDAKLKKVATATKRRDK